MIDKEQIIDWLEHPVTQAYKRTLEEAAAEAESLSYIEVDGKSVEEIGIQVAMKTNYINGIREATDFRNIFSEVLSDD